MIDTITNSPLFGISLCLFTFWIGTLIQKKFKSPLLNPLIISSAISIGILLSLDIPYENFDKGASFLSMLIAPATAILAVNIFEQRLVLKQYFVPVIVGCTVGAITSVASVYAICRFFMLDSSIIASLLPKSSTTAIALDLALSKGGIAAITTVTVLITGAVGAIFAPLIFKVFKIRDPVAQGIAIGASSHAFGTTKAVQMGEIQGSMSGIALSVTGIITVLLIMFIPV